MRRWWSWHDVMTVSISSVAMLVNAWAFIHDVGRFHDSTLFWPVMATLHFFLLFFMGHLALRAARRLGESRRAAAMDVTVIRDGEILPATLRYVGVSPYDGQHLWVIVDPLVEYGDEIHATMLPPKTTVAGMGFGPP